MLGHAFHELMIITKSGPFEVVPLAVVGQTALIRIHCSLIIFPLAVVPAV